jgi:hypothetical protein
MYSDTGYVSVKAAIDVKPLGSEMKTRETDQFFGAHTHVTWQYSPYDFV